MPELAAMRGIAVENVKAFVTRQSDDYRAPYARHAEARPRRFVVAGTTNVLGFLTDPHREPAFPACPMWFDTVWCVTV